MIGPLPASSRGTAAATTAIRRHGSERLPQYNTPWAVSALGFGGGWTDIATWKVLGHNAGGLRGVVLHLKDISLMKL